MSWDIFISHSSEDKASVVLPLADYLRSAGLTVWLDALELRLGDSIRQSIENGLAKSRFGVVVLSPSFLAKGWTTAELNGLFAREMAGMTKILPVWHDIDQRGLLQISPILADRYAISTEAGLVEVARGIVNVVLSDPTCFAKGPIIDNLVRLVEKGEIDQIKSFLRFYIALLQHAIGAANTYQTHVSFDNEDNSHALHFSFARSDSARRRLFVVQLASTSASDVSQIAPEIGLVKEACDHFRSRSSNRSPWEQQCEAKGVIVSGRRHLLRPEVQVSRGDLGVDYIEVRSYDWLIESAATYFDNRQFIEQQLPRFQTVAEMLAEETRKAEQKAARLVQEEARRKIPGQIEEVRQRAIALRLASVGNVDTIIYNMDVHQFKQLRGEYSWISRVDFKPKGQ